MKNMKESMSLHYENEFGPMFTPSEIRSYNFLASYEDPYDLDKDDYEPTPSSKNKSSFVKK